MSTLIIFNGKIVPTNHPCINYNDRSFTLGHGIFETILVNKSVIFAVDYHWRRFQTSARLIDIRIPFSYDEFITMLNEVIQINHLQNTIAGIRVTLSQGEAARGILAPTPITPNFVIMAFERALNGPPTLAGLIVQSRKNETAVSAKIKSTSYLDNILAKKEALAEGFDEAIFLNTVANLADGAVSNFFIVNNNQIYTPRVEDGALPGVIRQILLDDSTTHFSISEQTISLAMLKQADEIFLTNVLIGVKSLHRLNNQIFKSFEVANKIAGWLKDYKNYPLM